MQVKRPMKMTGPTEVEAHIGDNFKHGGRDGTGSAVLTREPTRPGTN